MEPITKRPRERIDLVVGPGREEQNEALGRLLRNLRLAADMSTKELASELGLSASFVRMVERGERWPAPATAADWIRALGAQADVNVDLGSGRHVDLVISAATETHDYVIDFKSRVRESRTGLVELTEQSQTLLAKVVEYLGGGDRAPSGRGVEVGRSLLSTETHDALLGRAVRALATARPEVLSQVLDVLASPPVDERDDKHDADDGVGERQTQSAKRG